MGLALAVLFNQFLYCLESAFVSLPTVYVHVFLGAFPRPPRSLPLDATGGLPFHGLPVPTVPTNSGYASAL